MLRKKVLVYLNLLFILAAGCGGGEVLETNLDLPEQTEEAPADWPEPVWIANYLDVPPLTFAKQALAPEVMGIYVTSNRIGIESYLDEVIALCQDTPLNAVVFDVKTELGEVTFKGGIPLADEMGLSVNFIPDVRATLAKLADHDIYSIARIVAFKDNSTVLHRPELYIRDSDGSIWRDPQKYAWLNPYNRDTWDYVLTFAIHAAELGFREIQFDYIRFAASSRLDHADMGDTMGKSRIDIIAEFSRYAMQTLKPLGVRVSADVYGTIINSDVDARIVGQDYALLAQIFDVLCPMVYPSHYANGTMGIDVPDLSPYETIYESMLLSEKRLRDIPEFEHRAIIRPWLQDFTATWLPRYREYGGVERGEQIRGVYDAGLTEWLLWDTAVRYSAEGISSAPERGEPVD